MSSVHRLCRLANLLERSLSVEHDENNFRFTVTIENVVYKKKHLRMSIDGVGFTIEDACYDYLRKAHGGELENWLTDKVIDVI